MRALVSYNRGGFVWGGTLLVVGAWAAGAGAAPVESLRVMTFNILGGAGRPATQFVDVIEAAQADLIGFQEDGSFGDDIALPLGFYYHQFNSDLSIASRYPITQVLIGGVKIELSPGQEVYLYTVHLPAFPYQPYGIRDGTLTTEAQAIAQAQSTRGIQAANRINHAAAALATGRPTFFVGDFNEPSHLDWTQAAADAGLNFNLKVDWPTSNAVVNAGYIDAFRELRPDEVNDRGETWTPGYEGMPANEVHDRIDFVYFAPNTIRPTVALTLGADVTDGNTDIQVDPYPTDHRAVVVEFDLMPGIPGDYNGDGQVDAGDYVRWRNHLGDTDETALNGNGDGGDVSLSDYTWWKQHYGTPNSGAASLSMTSVPEPATWTICMSFAWIWLARRRTAQA